MLEAELYALETVSGSRKRTIDVTRKTEVSFGTEKFKCLLEASLSGKPLKLFMRPNTPNFIPAWLMLKYHGFPTYSFVRKTHTKTGEMLVLPDLTANGSKLYGKSLAIALQENRNYIFRPSNIDKKFVHITLRYTKEIRARALQLAEKATKLGIILSDDGEPFELLVDADGNWDLRMVDIEQIRQKIEGLESNQAVAQANAEAVSDFLHNINFISKVLMSKMK